MILTRFYRYTSHLNTHSHGNMYSVVRNLNCNVASITRIHRLKYMRMYPTILVLPNGSSVNIRYFEPRQIITLPLDLTTLTEEERRIRLEKRRPKEKVKATVEIEEDFSIDDYLKYIKK